VNDERTTPRWFFDKVDEQFRFTLDAAATAKNTLCACYYDKALNGLCQPWSGHVVWCNPPYSRGQLYQWVEKANSEMGACSLLLIPGDCSTKASQSALALATAILFIDKRLAFDDEKSSAKFCSWLALFNGSAKDIARLRKLNMGVVK